MRRLPILILLGGGIVLSLLGFALVRNLEQQQLHVEFTEAAEDRIIAVRTTLATYLEPLDATGVPRPILPCLGLSPATTE
jgi:CHASE1-domain containing sensor protein